MKLSKTVAAALVAQILALQAFAQNRDAQDAVFDDQTKQNQVMVGITEYLIGMSLLPSPWTKPVPLTPEQITLAEAQDKFTRLQDTPRTEAQREELYKQVKENPKSYMSTGLPQQKTLTLTARKRLVNIEFSKVMPVNEWTTKILAAEMELTKAREAAITTAQKAGRFSNAIRVVRHGAALFLIVDATSRVIIWNAMDVDPKLAPATAHIHHLLK